MFSGTRSYFNAVWFVHEVGVGHGVATQLAFVGELWVSLFTVGSPALSRKL